MCGVPFSSEQKSGREPAKCHPATYHVRHGLRLGAESRLCSAQSVQGFPLQQSKQLNPLTHQRCAAVAAGVCPVVVSPRCVPLHDRPVHCVDSHPPWSVQYPEIKEMLKQTDDRFLCAPVMNSVKGNKCHITNDRFLNLRTSEILGWDTDFPDNDRACDTHRKNKCAEAECHSGQGGLLGALSPPPPPGALCTFGFVPRTAVGKPAAAVG